MRVLVCGGRDYSNRVHLFEILDREHSKTPFSVLIQGGARGADQLAREWASFADEIHVETYNADWSAGPSAGPERNQRMLDEGKPERVIAFPGGRGTADMVQRAYAAGLPVHEIVRI